MKKQHKFLTILLIIVLCVTMLTALIACDKPNESTGEVKDTSKIISNGNFEVTTSDTFPKTPGSWTASAGSTTSGNETDTDEKALVSGVIDTEQSVYDKNKKTWGRLKNPGKAPNTNDNNILMIYNKVDNSYKYTSSNFTLEANKYYQIDISIKTAELIGWGAYIKIGGDAFVEFPEINTNNEWLTYSAMIKTSNTASNSLNVVLSNGKDGKKDNKLSNGYAFFDNIVVTEVVNDKDGLTKEEKYKNFKNESETDVTKGVNDLTYGDTSFINVSGSKNPFTARKWTGVSSSGDDGETAPTGSDYMERGIVDITLGDIPTAATDLPKLDINKDNKVLMISNKQKTAYAYRSDNKIKIESGDNKYYKITVNILTKVEDTTKGAYLMIKSTTDKAESIQTISNINTNGQWEQRSIIVKADKKRSKEIYLQLGLGTGGKGDTLNNVEGSAFFDEISIQEVNADNLTTDEINGAAILESTIGSEITITDDPTHANNYSDGYYSKYDGIPDGYRGSKSDNGSDNKSNGVITIKNDYNGITRFIYNGKIAIEANNHYRLSFKVKTDLIHEDKGIDIKFYKKNNASIGNNRQDVEVTNSTITKFNSANVDEINIDGEGYTEFTFLFQGELNKTTYVYFEIIMGSGTNLTPDTLVKGSVSLKDFELYKVHYADYSSESGTYVKKNSFKEENDTTITNANFNQIDVSATKTQYESEHKDDSNEADRKFDEEEFLNQKEDGTGNSKGIFGLPLNWTTSSKDVLKNLYAGVFNVNNSTQKSFLDVTGNITDGLPTGIKDGNTNVLAISTKRADNNKIGTDWGFTSPSISLSKGKYYQLSVWARTTEASTARINLLSSSKTVLETLEVQAPTQGWREYIFYINAGFDNSTVYLELKLGNNDNESEVFGTVFFDRPTLVELTEEKYEEAEKIDNNEKAYKIATTFSTITFDNVTSNSEDETLDSADGWTGSHADTDAPTGDGKSIAGVYNRNHSNRNWFGKGLNGEGDEPILPSTLDEIMNSVVDKDGNKEMEKNNNILVINNNVASEYTYSTTLAENSLTAEKYYEISLWVLTYDVAENQTAKLQLKLHNSTYTFDKDDTRGINVNTGSQWRKYSYFISTEENADIDNVELSISLGTSGKDNYVKGYLFVDNVSISEIDEERFNEQVPVEMFPTTSEEAEKLEYTDEVKKVTSVNQRIVFTADDLNKDPEEETEKKVDPLLWLYITSGIIGGLIIIVAIIFVLKKFNIFAKFSKKTNFNEKGSETYNRNRVDANKSNAQNRDINKKHQD